jgi:hypothetical protein
MQAAVQFDDRGHAPPHDPRAVGDFCGDEAITSLADLLKDPVDRYRALNFVLEVAGPMEELDAPTVAMFRLIQATLMTLAREWCDPDLVHAPQPAPAEPAAPATATHDTAA